MHGREDELGQNHEDHDPVQVCTAFFGLCAFASLSLLFDLNGLSYPQHESAFVNCRRRWKGACS